MNDKRYDKLKQHSIKHFKEIKLEDEKPAPFKETAGANYAVVLINITDNCLVYGRINNGKFFAIPTICRTCSQDFDTCFNEQRWAGVLTTGCADPAFDLTLITKPDSSGNSIGATWRITPDCNFAGGVIGLQ